MVTLYFNSPDILQTISNFSTTCQSAVIRVLVDCFILMFNQQTSTDYK